MNCLWALLISEERAYLSNRSVGGILGPLVFGGSQRQEDGMIVLLVIQQLLLQRYLFLLSHLRQELIITIHIQARIRPIIILFILFLFHRLVIPSISRICTHLLCFSCILPGRQGLIMRQFEQFQLQSDVIRQRPFIFSRLGCGLNILVVFG